MKAQKHRFSPPQDVSFFIDVLSSPSKRRLESLRFSSASLSVEGMEAEDEESLCEYGLIFSAL